MPSQSMTVCPDCGVHLDAVDGVTHAYLGGSQECWATFNEILAREFQDEDYFSVHRYTTDAYTTQHPGDQSDRRAAQSVNIHLAALCALIEQKRELVFIPRLLKTLANKYKDRFKPLAPPDPKDYEITVKDVLATTNVEEHKDIVMKWAETVWWAWKPHHDTARHLVQLIDQRS